MITFKEPLSDIASAMLTRLIGRPLAWLYGTRFVVTRECVIAERFWLDLPGEFLSFGCARFETPDEYLDYFSFLVGVSTNGPTGSDRNFRIMDDVSVVQVSSSSVVDRISVYRDSFVGNKEEVAYDAWIELSMVDGTKLSFGPAPTVYEGICFREGPPLSPLPSYSRIRSVVVSGSCR